MVDLSEYLSRGEVALALRCSGEYVSQLARTGRLPSVASPNGRLFHRRDVERLAAARAGPDPINRPPAG
jgi:excisionase family DNA binding protein